jgi:hypothetical protein
MSSITRALAELADELAHAERLVEEQAQRIESLEAEIALVRNLFGSATA